MKRKRHNHVAEGFSAGVRIKRKLCTADYLLTPMSAGFWKFRTRPINAGSRYMAG